MGDGDQVTDRSRASTPSSSPPVVRVGIMADGWNMSAERGEAPCGQQRCWGVESLTADDITAQGRPDFGFWILNFGLTAGLELNPKSIIQSPKLARPAP